VSGGFLDKLWRRAPSLPAGVAEVVGELTELARTRPAIAGPATILAEVLPCLSADPVRETPPPLTVPQMEAKLAGGMPLLRGEPVVLDAVTFARRWQGICAAVHRRQGGEGATTLARALGPEGLEPTEMVQHVLAGRPEAVHARADALGLDAALTGTVLRWALFPVLAAFDIALKPRRQGIAWDHGLCPTCGSWPLLGEFRGLEQTRWLRCGLCAAEWEFPRLRCPFCDNRDHRQLGYVHVEGEEGKQRVATCDACRGYVKMVSTLGALTAPRLLATDVATLHLDLAAGERGFYVA
jgi:FdhE protein